MEELLAGMIGRKVDIVCAGSPSLRGEILKVEAGVVHLRSDDGHICYAAANKIAVMWEVTEDAHTAGFVSPRNDR